MQKIISKIECNKIKCKKCGDVIESTYRHDFKFCKCGAVAVDGGKDYLRRLGNIDDYEEMSFVRKLVKITMDGFENVETNFKQQEILSKEKIVCPICNSKNISILKGDGELILGNDAVAIVCHSCKKIYKFCDVKYKKEF